MSNLLEKAIAVALEAHAGVMSRSGRPYILHPLRLMIQMESEEEMITAVLHDVVEDSSITLVDLAEIGFSQRVLDALALLTHNKATTDYNDYIIAIKANSLARKIKLADLAHNMDLRRLPNPLSQKDLNRLQKYRQAWKTLAGH
jgi:(p)ppGpp synthase/HD superfamily hydrolase